MTNIIRETVKNQIHQIFEKGGYDDLDSIATDTEKSIFNSSVKSCKEPAWENEIFVCLYKTKALKVIDNLTTNPNTPLLWDMIDSGDIAPEELVDANPQQLDPERWEKTRKSIIDKVKFEKPDPSTMPDGAFTCGKCKSKKTTYYQLQVRSADEPLSNFHQCQICCHRWRS